MRCWEGVIASASEGRALIFRDEVAPDSAILVSLSWRMMEER